MFGRKKLLGNHVKFSRETLKENPAMIRREYDIRIDVVENEIKRMWTRLWSVIITEESYKSLVKQREERKEHFFNMPFILKDYHLINRYPWCQSLQDAEEKSGFVYGPDEIGEVVARVMPMLKEKIDLRKELIVERKKYWK